MDESMKNPKPMIHVRDIRKVYHMGDEEVVALNRINLKIYKGEICCIFGTSGSGKSTLLNQLAGMEKPTRGKVFIRGENISRMNEDQLAGFRQLLCQTFHRRFRQTFQQMPESLMKTGIHNLATIP